MDIKNLENNNELHENFNYFPLIKIFKENAKKYEKYLHETIRITYHFVIPYYAPLCKRIVEQYDNHKHEYCTNPT